MTDNHGYMLSAFPVAPVNETDMVLLPEGLNALKKVAKMVGLDLGGAYEDVANLLNLASFEVIYHRTFILLPMRFPLLTRFANRYLAQLLGFRSLCLTNWIVARPFALEPPAPPPTVSVICACRNEEGNIEQIARRVPEMASGLVG
jgi:hypothetical protein